MVGESARRVGVRPETIVSFSEIGAHYERIDVPNWAARRD
jgi:hypothetical protein